MDIIGYPFLHELTLIFHVSVIVPIPRHFHLGQDITHILVHVGDNNVFIIIVILILTLLKYQDI